MEPSRPEPEPVSLGMILRLFLVPLAVVGASALVFLLFGTLAGERKTARDYIEEIRGGTEIRRWQAAYELAAWIASRSPEDLRRDDATPELIQLFRESRAGDPRIPRYLALALGRLRDPRATEALLVALEGQDAETVIYSAWALGNLGEDRASPGLARLLGHPDPGVRKMAAHSLGALGAPAAAIDLRRSLLDPSLDVTWNAALALGRLGDPAGLDLLLRMADRRYLLEVASLEGSGAEEILINAVRSLAHLGDPAARPRLEALGRDDPSLRVRSAAREALDRLPSGIPPAP